MNAYYNPAKLGLTILGELDQDDLCYEFNKLVVWQHKNRELYWAEDSGCSCPSPFEDYTTLDSLQMLYSYREFMKRVREFPAPVHERMALLRKVRDAMLN